METIPWSYSSGGQAQACMLYATQFSKVRHIIDRHAMTHAGRADMVGQNEGGLKWMHVDWACDFAARLSVCHVFVSQ